jgi:hypothetical protein
MAVARDLVEQTPVGAAERWVRKTAHEATWPRKIVWLAASLAVGAAAVLLAIAIANNDPVLEGLLRAPLDDEPLSPEEAAELEEARRAIRAGEGVSLKDYLAQHKDG